MMKGVCHCEESVLLDDCEASLWEAISSIIRRTSSKGFVMADKNESASF
jgi:hypothetical protein